MSLLTVSSAIPRQRGVAALFVGTVFLSAALLFSVQPMFTKMVLPVLGGTPAVWSVAMVVFQALLLAGYAYAHLLVRFAPGVTGGLIHVLATGLVAATLPLALASGWGAPPPSGEAVWLAGLFLASVGLPFFVLSANGPLLQAWFARSGHAAADRAYALYAASNLGSFVALLAYPLAIEPLLGLDAQGELWARGFVILVAGLAGCALVAGRGAASAASDQREAAARPVTVAQRISWVALAFVPSGLLVAVSAHIQTDVAAAPLLWVLPLALFLLTFVLAFRDTPWPGLWVLEWLQAWGAAAALAMLYFGAFELSVMLATTLGLFFANAMICHHALYRRRPEPSRLTEFYLFVSLGGVLGGLFAALIAPQIFSSVAEYPALIIAALLCRPGLAASLDGVRSRLGGALVLRAGLVGVVALAVGLVSGAKMGIAVAIIGVMVSMMLVRRDPAALVAHGIGLWLVVGFAAVFGPGNVQSWRSFFGVHRAVETADGRFRQLYHGTTVHGAIRLRGDDGRPVTGRPEPTTYYVAGGSIAEGLDVARQAKGGAIGTVGIVGLGAGSLACHAHPGEAWTFYEIDPEVIRIARNPALFRFLSDCTPTAPIVQGDARLTLAAATGRADFLLVDAFSSDAIPTHLLTLEALGLLLARTSETGVLAFHISNRHLDLAPILGQAAARLGVQAWLREGVQTEPYEVRMAAPARVVLLTRTPAAAQAAQDHGWRALAPDPTVRPWTDNYTNLMAVLWR